jgi:RHS repeat-associated protein
MIPPGSYLISDFENISLTNGNVNLSIPLAALPPIAGGKLGWEVRAVYNSKIWDVAKEERRVETWPDYVVNVPQVSDQGGWTVGGIYSIFYRESHEDYDWLEPSLEDPEHDYVMANGWYKVFLLTPDGAKHELFPMPPEGSGLAPFSPYHGTREFLLGYFNGTPSTKNQTMGYYTYDGSFLWATIEANGNWKLYFPDGKRIETNSLEQRIYDVNGNFIRIYATEMPGITITRHFEDGQNPSRKIELVTHYDETPLHQEVRYWSVGGAQKTIDIYWGSTDVDFAHKSQDPGCEQSGQPHTTVPNWNEQIHGALSVIRSIVFPQTEPGNPNPPYFQGRLKYQFFYNSDSHQLTYFKGCPDCSGCPNLQLNASMGMGQLNSMIIPSGAEVRYAHYLDGQHLLEDTYELARDAIVQKQVLYGAKTDTWEYVMTGNHALVVNPDGSTIAQDSGQHDLGLSYAYAGAGSAGLVYRTNYSDKRIVEQHWTGKPFSIPPQYTPAGFTSWNQVVDAEYTSLKENGSLVTMSAKTFQHDYNGNVVNRTDYHWFAPGLVSRDSNGVPTGVPGSATAIRSTGNGYYNPALTADSPNAYSKRPFSYSGPRVLTAMQQATMGASVTQYEYDSGYKNLTHESRWDNLHGVWLDTWHTYDSRGNRLTTTDPRGKVTTFSYSDETFPLPTSVTVDPQNGTGQQTVQTAYDIWTGRITSQMDPNGRTTDTDYSNQRLGGIDAFARPGLVTGPPVTGGARKVVTKYYDNARQTEVLSDLNSSGDGILKSLTTLDQLGRPWLSDASENGSYAIQSQTLFDNLANGQVVFTSNPSRGTGESTDGWTRTTKDVLGRVIEAATFSGASPPPLTGTNGNWTGSVTTSYFANETTVTDQAGKSRRSIADAVGRIVQVIEDPSYLAHLTIYSYDALDNLTAVQKGAQTRTFTYDSLGRLANAQNPESGAVVYDYDGNGNLTQRTDARGIITHYTYDGINRLKQRSYSDGTPMVDLYYDAAGVLNSKGRLTSVVSSVSTYTYDEYDAMGRVMRSTQTTGTSGPHNMSYGYNLANGMTSETYPSGRVVTTFYDLTGRVETVSSGGTNYASAFTYTAAGAAKSLKYGNERWEHTNFNSRLQPLEIGLGSNASDSSQLRLIYDYGTTANNGNVLSQGIQVPGASWNQIYTYDSLNRLQNANEGGWNQTYGYDPYGYGNRAVIAGYVPNPLLTPQSPADFETTNRLAESLGWHYDAAGNLTVDRAGRSFEYDPENRQKSFNGTAATYFYDGEGRRVKKIDASGTTVFVYDATGKLVAEFASQPPSGGGRTYITQDHLGSTRIVTDQTGAVVARHDYLPFGEELPSANIGDPRYGIAGYAAIDVIPQRFSGKERDAESGLDYFGARYCSGPQGRFTSVDPYNPIFDSADEDDFRSYLVQPQNWNRYSYAWNNPLRFVDPSGELVELTGSAKDQEEALKRLKEMLGTSALGTRTEKGHTYVTYTGKGDAAKILGEFGEMLSGSKTVEFRIAEKFDYKGGMGQLTSAKGGGVTVGAEESLTGNTQIFVHPKAGAFADQWGRTAMGIMSSTEKGRLRFTNDIVDAHEFGHAWGQFKFGLPIRFSQATNPHAVQWENRQRALHPWTNRRKRR